MELVHAQQLLAQAHIAVHGVQIVVDGLDQVVVDLGVHLGLGQSGVESGGIAPGVGKELQLLHLGAQDGGAGVAELAVHAVEGLEGGLTQGPVGGLEQSDIVAVGDGVGLALAVGGVGVGHVGVVEEGEDVVGGLTHPLGGGQQSLAVGGEGVVLPAADALEHQPVVGQSRLLFIEGLQGGVLNGQQLGGLEGEGLAQLHQEVLGLGAHLLIHGIAGVLVALAEGVGDHPVALEVDLVLKAEEGQQGSGALAQTATVCGQITDQAADVLAGLTPGLIAGVQVGDGPGVGRVHLTAGGKGMCHS